MQCHLKLEGHHLPLHNVQQSLTNVYGGSAKYNSTNLLDSLRLKLALALHALPC